jgi:haloalkane dehalogenase
MNAPSLPSWLAAQLPFSRSLVSVGEWRMHVMQAGQGLPVLMLHGNPSWGFLWRKVAAALAPEPLRLIMPDLIGLGLSEKPRDPRLHTLENHARWLNAALDALAVDELVLVAQDWGGPVGLRAQVDRPRAVAMVLANTVIGPPRPGFRPTPFHRFAHLPLVSDVVFRLGFPQNVMALVQGDRRSISGDVARAYRWPLRHVADRVAPLALARMVPDSPAHPSVPSLRRCQAWVEQFTGPLHLVWGERDPVLGRVINFLERHLPQAKVTRTSGGHFLQEEVPGPIAAAVRDVVARAGRTPGG